jgi:Arc/MetJ family transcription regulator
MCNIVCDSIGEVIHMATNLQIDDKLILKAVKLGRHKTKKAAVSKALEEYIQHLEQQKILSMFGKIDYDPQYYYKKQRLRT